MRRSIAGLTVAILVGYLLATTVSERAYEITQPAIGLTLAGALLSQRRVVVGRRVSRPGGK
jgi:hypothetical protein